MSRAAAPTPWSGLAAILAVVALPAMAIPPGAAAEDAPSGMMRATAHLAADRTTFTAGEPVVVHVTLANPGDHRVAVLRWLTPLAGVDAPLFAVTRDGAPVAYRGRMVKRPAPTDADYVTLEPGASVTTDVDLAPLYALATPGRYDVQYDVTSPQLYLPGKNAPPTDGRLASAALTIVVAGSS